MGIVTRADIVRVLLSIVPYAPSSIIDAVSGYVELLVNYSPLSPDDDATGVVFAISMKFLDECYDGASPRDVFMDIIKSMSNDLEQPFPDYKNVYDAELRRELIKELSFRWCLFTNVSNHISTARRPDISVQELEDYFVDLDVCDVPSPVPQDDNSSCTDGVEEESVSTVDLPEVCIEDHTNCDPSEAASPENAPPHVDLQPTKFEPFKIKVRPSKISDLTPDSNGTYLEAKRFRKRRPLSFYRTFYASWSNGIDAGASGNISSPLLLFRGRKPKWRKLNGYDLTIPWRHKV